MRPTLVFLCLSLLVSCTRTPTDFEAALVHYQQNELEHALPILEDLATLDPPEERVVTYLAETYRRLGKKEEAIRSARRVLNVNPCNSFAHTVIAEASNPLVGDWAGADPETTWVHLLRAAECDPADGNPWLMIWGESIRRGEHDMTVTAGEKMIETGFFTPALLAYTEWVLLSAPANAILITNGDMDTYPVAALQAVEDIRPDVVLVNRGTLNKAWLARYLRDVKGVSLPFSDTELDELDARQGVDGVIETPSDDMIRGWIDMWSAGRIRHPVAFAMTVPADYVERVAKPTQYAGAVRVVTTQAIEGPDVGTIKRALENFTSEDFFGPWVSEQDRSPVRRVGTNNIVRNVTHAALTLSEAMRGEGNSDEAARWLEFAEAVDSGSELGPVYRERLHELREKQEE